PRPGRDSRVRDRSRGTYRSARKGPAVAHPRARDPPQPGGDPRHLPARDGRRGPGADRHPGRAHRGGPAVPAAGLPVRTGRHQRRELRRRRDGNGRMCLTLPDTLITVMGIEKVVPAWRDLDVFMQLLPRSSTGERMNPYTSMWTGV